MRKSIMVSGLVTFGCLVILSLACTGVGDRACGNGLKAELLKSLLNAGDDGAYDRALQSHGPVTIDELPCILDAIDSWFPSKRRNGATTLGLVGGDRDTILKAQKKVVLETKDVFVWAKVYDSLVSPRADANPAELAAKRHDMIEKALADDDGFIQSVGLKAGVLGKYPGIGAELEKRLDSMDTKILQVALDALPSETARSKLTKLLGILDEYETGSKYKNPKFKIDVFVPLLNALIRSEDPHAYVAVRTALEKGYQNPRTVKGTREEMLSFRSSAAAVGPNEYTNRFCYYLIEENSIAAPTAVDILTTQVWTKKYEPTVKLIEICVKSIENGNLDTIWSPKIKYKPEQTSCERLFKFLETGENPINSEHKTKHGADALKIGKKWLAENE